MSTLRLSGFIFSMPGHKPIVANQIVHTNCKLLTNSIWKRMIKGQVLMVSVAIYVCLCAFD